MTGWNVQIQPSKISLVFTLRAMDVTGIVSIIVISPSQKPLGPFNSLIPPCQSLLMLIPASSQSSKRHNIRVPEGSLGPV